MVTLRFYWNPVEAALAKLMLDDHGIFCTLADENANLYGGAPFAMPVRLLVGADQAKQALCILGGRWDALERLQSEAALSQAESGSGERKEFTRNNPWEILDIASVYLLPGICLVLQKHPVILLSPRRSRVVVSVLSTSSIHGAGWLAVAVALLLIALYVYARRETAGDQSKRTLS